MRGLLLFVLTATCVAGPLLFAGESPANGGSPQPYARVRVSIPSTGGRAEIRETSTADPSQPVDAPSDEKRATGPAVLASLYGREITEEDVVRELLERRGRDTLDWLIGRNILDWELERLDLTVGDDEVEERLGKHLEGFRKTFPNLTRPDDLTRATSGMRLDEYRERVVWSELALRKIMRTALKPTNEQLRGYYAERQAEFIKPERVRISQVFVAPQPAPDGDGIADADDWRIAERQILEAHSRLRMGEDFAVVARAYGTGGQLSRWVGRGELLRELEEAAFAIGEGSNTMPLKSSMGYHIILVEKKQERKIPPFEEAREEVLDQYEEMRFVLLAGEFMVRLRDKALKNGGLVMSPEGEAFPEAGDESERED